LRTHSPRAARPPALPPGDTLPNPASPAEAQPPAGGASAESPGRAPGAGLRTDTSDRTDELRPESAAFALIAAGIGLARLADRQALRLATSRRRRATTTGRLLSIRRIG